MFIAAPETAAARCVHRAVLPRVCACASAPASAGVRAAGANRDSSGGGQTVHSLRRALSFNLAWVDRLRWRMDAAHRNHRARGHEDDSCGRSSGQGNKARLMKWAATLMSLLPRAAARAAPRSSGFQRVAPTPPFSGPRGFFHLVDGESGSICARSGNAGKKFAPALSGRRAVNSRGPS